MFNAEYYVDIGQVRVLAFYDAGQVRDVGDTFVWTEPIVQINFPPSAADSEPRFRQSAEHL